MINVETQQRFLQLRSQGWTLSKIMHELNVSKPTLIAWSRKFRFEIENARAIEREALREKWLASTAVRVNALGEELRKVETELAKRDVTTLPTARLYALADSLRKRIERETGPITFTTPVSEIPNEEYHEQVQDWTP
jgi:transcriptional regulator